MNEDLKQAVLAEIEAFYRMTELQPGDVTIADVAKQLEKSDETARVLMRKLVAEGKFTRLCLKVDGQRTAVFRKVESPHPSPLSR